MKKQYFKINVFGKGIYGRNRTPKGINFEIAQVESIPESLDSYVGEATKRLNEMKVKSGVANLGVFQAEEDDDMVFVHLMPKKQLNVLNGELCKK